MTQAVAMAMGLPRWPEFPTDPDEGPEMAAARRRRLLEDDDGRQGRR